MINLELSTTQIFSTDPAAVLTFQDWEFNTGNLVEISSFIGEIPPNNILVETKIKNYIAQLGTEIYDEYYVELTPTYFQAGTVIEFISIAGTLSTPSPGYLITENNLNQTTTIQFQNLQVLSQGLHKVRIDHIVRGKTAAGEYVQLASIPLHINLNRSSFNDLIISPQEVEFSHIIGEALPPSQSINISRNGYFIIKCGKHLTLTGGNISFEAEVEGIKTYTGTDSQTLQLNVEASIEIEGEQLPFFTAYIEGSTLDGLGFDTTLVKITQTETTVYNLTPNTLSFQAIKGQVAAPERLVTLTGIGSFSITSYPNWLNVSPLSGTNNSFVYVSPIDADNLAEGIYTGQIVFNTTSGESIVNVFHEVIGLYNLGFNLDDLNFTNDHNTITTITLGNTPFGSSKYVTLEIENTAFKYGLLFSTLKTASFKKAVTNGDVDFFIGNTIKKLMPSISNLDQIGFVPLVGFNLESYGGLYKYYNPTNTKIVFSIVDVSNTEVAQGSVSQNIQFIKGRKPSRINSDFGVVDYNTSPIRVTTQGVAMFNCYVKRGYKVIKIFKNGVLTQTINPSNGSFQVFGIKILFSLFSPGDTVDVRLYKRIFPIQGEQEYESQSYIVLPQGNNSYHIGYEDEHGLLQLLECTGNYKITNKYKNIEATSFVDYIEKTNNIGFLKTTLLQANTGWMFKSNIDRINSIAASKRCWLYYDINKAPIAMVPQIKKIENVDSPKELYAFSLDFKLNLTNDFENYTF